MIYKVFSAAAVGPFLLLLLLAPIWLTRQPDRVAAMPAQTRQAPAHTDVRNGATEPGRCCLRTSSVALKQRFGVARLVTCTQCRPAAMCHDSSK